MAKKSLVQTILEEPEIKERYGKMNSYQKFFFKVGAYILNIRKKITDIQPSWYVENNL